MSSFLKIVPLAATLVITSGCATAGTGTNSVEGPQVGKVDRMMITVANNHSSEIIVYVENGSSRVRLGRVGSMRTEGFPPPRAFANNGQSLRLVARLLGGQSGYSTELIPIHPGQDVQLNIQNNLSASSWVVWLR